MWKIMREMYPDMMGMGTGTCTRCKTCTYPDAPCRFPDELVSSMEACGLVVSEVCTANGVPYNHGKDTICSTETACSALNTKTGSVAPTACIRTTSSPAPAA